MILAPHILAGSALTLLIGNPILGVPAAIISHYFLDATPHAEYSIHGLEFLRTGKIKSTAPVFIKIFWDIGLATLLILFFAHYAHQSIMLAVAGGFAGIAPDFTTFLFILFPNNKILQKHYAFHQKIHFPKNKYAPAYLRYGLQITVILISLLAIVISLPR